MNAPLLYSFRQKKLYLAMNHINRGEPLGDPFGGPAYGERNGPAVALVSAGMSIYGGMAIMGTSALMGGLMIAGGVMSGLGAITGNKTLSTLGMVAGLAGGVGQFFQQGGFESFSMAAQADGATGVVDQFTGNVEYGYGFPGNDVPALDPASQALQDAGSASRAQQIINESASPFSGAGQDYGVQIPGNPVTTIAPAANPAAAAAKVAGGAAKKTGLLGLWEDSGDFTKGMVVKGVTDAIGGAGDSVAAKEKAAAEKQMFDESLAVKKSQVDSGNELTAAQTEAIDKKNAGVPMVSVDMGGKGSGPYGLKPDGSPKSRDEYLADYTASMRRLFGTQQQAAA